MSAPFQMGHTLKTYPSDFRQKIGFDRISQLLHDYCVSVPGKEKVDALVPSSDRKEIERNLILLEELQKLISDQGVTLPEQGFYDLRKEISLLGIEGNWWEPEQFIELRSLLRTSREVIRLLHKQDSEFLKPLYHHITFPDNLLKRLEKIFTDQGNISDQASPELARIRSTIEQNRHQVRKTLELVFRNAKKEGWVPEGASISVRDGRMVIPLVAEAKRRLSGFIHDESATGQTVFMEPAAVLEGNNKQRELEYEERREVIKILKKITEETSVEGNTINEITELMGEIDFLRAKLKLANRLKAIKPLLSNESSIDLRGGRHPILLITDHEVVPLDIKLDNRQRIVLISGPNAGGKSVALKTVSLLQYMLQCGMFVPVSEGSVMGTFSKIFIDIGDEQSIENDLSTYSSHLRNMRFMLDSVDDKTLILIDEFGSGTEPHFGGALAESMLEEFTKSEARGVITTHYANLKTFAEKHDGVVNAAMLFDMKKMLPLYELSVGKPGSSHALDIAQKTGLPASIIDKAKKLLGRETIDYDKALATLQDQLKKIQIKEELLEKREENAKNLQEEYQKLRNDLDSNKKQLLAKAKGEAEAIVTKANKEIEKTIRHIKENKAEKKETKKIRQRLQEFRQQNEEVAKSPSEKITDNKPLQKGDYVELSDSNVAGQVLEIQGKKAEVLLGDLKTTVALNRLVKINRKDLKKQQNSRRKGMDFTSKLANFSTSVDIRGKRVEEAISLVDKFIDDALLAGASEVKILHGKGNGILKEVVRNHLKGYKQVHRMADEHIERGGAGITVVNLED